MNNTCEKFQELLCENGLKILSTEKWAEEHCAECENCFTFLGGISTLDRLLPQLPEHDVPDSVVDGLIRQVEHTVVLAKYSKSASRKLPSFNFGKFFWKPAFATCFTAFLALVITSFFGNSASTKFAQVGFSMSGGGVRSESSSAKIAMLESPLADRKMEESAQLAYQRSEQVAGVPQGAPLYAAKERQVNQPRENESYNKSLGAAPAAPASSFDADYELSDRMDLAKGVEDDGEATKEQEYKASKDSEIDKLILDEGSILGKSKADKDNSRGRAIGATGKKSSWQDTEAPVDIERFLLERALTKDLSFKEASGYWSNTYVPGDKTLRELQSKLLNSDRSELQNYNSTILKLEDASKQPQQPFDPPQDGAMAVYLHGDRSGVTGETRMLLQVGLKGTTRMGGSRPAMNVGLVLDLREPLNETSQAQIEALIWALEKVKDIGDRFSVTVAGIPGGMIIPADKFTHGYIKVTLRSLFNEGEKSGAALELATAIKETSEYVKGAEDPQAPLGSSLIILVTSGQSGFEPQVVAASHSSSVNGIPLSVVTLNKNGDNGGVDRLVLAGQGNRRILNASSEAEELIKKELFAASRVIARALRLRIRLAPGVKLVDIPGSYRLDLQDSERQREMEKSIDRRLSKNLGIESDRGEDEEGVQIIIPAFYSGDSHVILLDVVVPGPGAIADVQLRYKDIVRLRNGVSRSNLTLPRAESKQGALEQNVLKNFLALKLSTTLEEVSTLLARGNESQALLLTKSYHSLLEGVRQRFPGLSRDADLLTDIQMLSEYRNLLETGAWQTQLSRAHLVNSLAYSGKLKVLPRPRQE